MEGWLIFIVVIGAIWLIVWLNNRVSSYEGSKRQKRLDEIAHDVLGDFDFNKEKAEIKSIGSKYVPKAYRCPECNGILILREGIYGKFLGCNHYPDCNFFSLIKENEKMKPVRVQDVYKVYETSRCPKCNGVLVLRNGMYGKFLGCSRYPKCKYTRST